VQKIVLWGSTFFCSWELFFCSGERSLLSTPYANGYSFTFFSTFFLSPIFVYFPKKVNPRCLQLYSFTFLFVCFCLRPLSTMLGILTLLFFGFGANTFPPSTSASQLPCPSPPTVCLAIPVNAATCCLSPFPFLSPLLFRLSPFQLIVVFPPTTIAVAAVVFVTSPLPWLSPSRLLLPLHLPSPQLQSSLPPSTPLPPSL
jgi:hypothetical protein